MERNQWVAVALVGLLIVGCMGCLIIAGTMTGALGGFVQGIKTGWETAEVPTPERIVETVEVPVKETVEVPVKETVEVEKFCVVPCVPPCVMEPCEPCVEPCKEVTPTTTPVSGICGEEPEDPDYELKKEETWQVPTCWTCAGDLVVEGQQLYDEGRPETGLIIFFEEPATIYAPWGANCLFGDHRIDKEAELRATGCEEGKGCEKVDIKVWPLSKPIPTPSAQPSVETDQEGKHLGKDEEFEVPKGWCCSGDIKVWNGTTWQQLYDSGVEGTEWTGLVTCFQQAAKIQAPFGAYCDPDDGTKKMKERLLAGGCEKGKGCKTVKEVTWPN